MKLKSKAQRIHIIGGPGSGKTTLARRLALHLKTTAIDLDEIGYEGGAGAKRPLALRLADVRQIAARRTWVTEGVFLWWVDDLVRAADVVIWLDLPWPLAAWRIVARHVRLSLAGTNRHPGLLKLLGFLRWVRTYYVRANPVPVAAPDDDGAVSRAATVRYLEPYRAKVIHCRRPVEVAALVQFANIPEK